MLVHGQNWSYWLAYLVQEASDNPHAAGQSADDIFMRDYSGPTGEDKLNREMLPQVLYSALPSKAQASSSPAGHQPRA